MYARQPQRVTKTNNLPPHLSNNERGQSPADLDIPKASAPDALRGSLFSDLLPSQDGLANSADRWHAVYLLLEKITARLVLEAKSKHDKY